MLRPGLAAALALPVLGTLTEFGCFSGSGGSSSSIWSPDPWRESGTG